jgi:hypothetical protein
MPDPPPPPLGVNIDSCITNSCMATIGKYRDVPVYSGKMSWYSGIFRDIPPYSMIFGIPGFHNAQVLFINTTNTRVYFMNIICINNLLLSDFQGANQNAQRPFFNTEIILKIDSCWIIYTSWIVAQYIKTPVKRGWGFIRVLALARVWRLSCTLINSHQHSDLRKRRSTFSEYKIP